MAMFKDKSSGPLMVARARAGENWIAAIEAIETAKHIRKPRLRGEAVEKAILKEESLRKEFGLARLKVQEVAQGWTNGNMVDLLD